MNTGPIWRLRRAAFAATIHGQLGSHGFRRALMPPEHIRQCFFISAGLLPPRQRRRRRCHDITRRDARRPKFSLMMLALGDNIFTIGITLLLIGYGLYFTIDEPFCAR